MLLEEKVARVVWKVAKLATLEIMSALVWNLTHGMNEVMNGCSSSVSVSVAPSAGDLKSCFSHTVLCNLLSVRPPCVQNIRTSILKLKHHGVQTEQSEALPHDPDAARRPRVLWASIRWVLRVLRVCVCEISCVPCVSHPCLHNTTTVYRLTHCLPGIYSLSLHRLQSSSVSLRQTGR